MYFKTQQNNCKCVLRFNVLFTFTSSCDWLSLIVLLCCGCWMGWLQLEAPEGPKRVSLDTEKQKETENKHKKTFGGIMLRSSVFSNWLTLLQRLQRKRSCRYISITNLWWDWNRWNSEYFNECPVKGLEVRGEAEGGQEQQH